MSSVPSACQFPKCCRQTTSLQYKYCPFHNWTIKDGGNCYNCLKKKEKLHVKLCDKCHREDMERIKRHAIDGGFCVNVWKCSKSASRKGGMCYDCFREYNTKVYERKPYPQAVDVKVSLISNDIVPQSSHIDSSFPPLPVKTNIGSSWANVVRNTKVVSATFPLKPVSIVSVPVSSVANLPPQHSFIPTPIGIGMSWVDIIEEDERQLPHVIKE